jgi:hypothetical protein
MAVMVALTMALMMVILVSSPLFFRRTFSQGPFPKDTERVLVPIFGMGESRGKTVSRRISGPFTASLVLDRAR